MPYPFRTVFHSSRKALIQRIGRMWPSMPLSSVSHTTGPAERKVLAYRDDLPALPDQAQEWLHDHAGRTEFEGVISLTRPATVDPKMGIVFIGGKVVWGTSDTPDRERSPRFLSHLASPARNLPSAISLHHVHGDNFFHFFFFIMSKVAVAEQSGLDKDIPFLVSQKTADTSFFKQAMEMGAFGNRQVVIQKKREVIAVDQLYLVRDHLISRQTMDWISNRFGVGQNEPDGDPLFLFRGESAANGRKFRNQLDVTRLAESYGFAVVEPADLTLKEQVTSFARAPAVAGPHGAGLTNLLFRRANACQVLELFSPGMGSPHYFMLCREKGFGYQSRMTLNPRGRDFTADTEVDLNDLDETLCVMTRSST